MTLNPLPNDKVFFDALCDYLDGFGKPLGFDEIQFATNEFYMYESPRSDCESPSYGELIILNTMAEDYCKLRYPDLLPND